MDSNVKTYAKVFIIVLDYSQENLATTKSKGYFDRKSLTSSPRTMPKNMKGGAVTHDHPSKNFESDYESISLLKHNQGQDVNGDLVCNIIYFFRFQ